MNTDRPTPETDATQHEGLLRTNPIPMQVVTANFARKLERERDEAREALRDMLSGWRYIRFHHGDLYGVGWDRAQAKAEKALEGAK